MSKTQQFVRIEHKGETRQGQVVSSVNYGTAEKPNWYIEFTDERDGLYYYVKQEPDSMADAKISFYQVGDELPTPAADEDGDPKFVLSILEETFEPMSSKGEIIAIYYNDGAGYHTTTYGRQTREWLDMMNARLGVSVPVRMAFEICSLFGHWENYIRTLSMLEAKFGAGEQSPARLQFIRDIIYTALEGGINYWTTIMGYKNGHPEEGVSIIEQDGEEETEEAPHRRHMITRATIEKGLELISKAHGNVDAGKDLVLCDQIVEQIFKANKNDDFGTLDAFDADVIVQVGLFGKVIYG